MGDRAFASATETIRRNSRSAHRLHRTASTSTWRARGKRHNPALNAIVVWQVDQAREERAPAPPPMLPLRAASVWGNRCTGIPMTVKEIVSTLRACRRPFGNPLLEGQYRHRQPPL